MPSGGIFYLPDGDRPDTPRPPAFGPCSFCGLETNSRVEWRLHSCEVRRRHDDYLVELLREELEAEMALEFERMESERTGVSR